MLLVPVTERNAEKRRNSAFYTLPRVACREDCSDWLNLELLALDKPTRPLLSSDWSESDSSIQPLYGKFHALCLPVGGASLANDDVMRGGGAAEIGMWRKQVR